MKTIPNLLQIATSGGETVLADSTVDIVRFAGSNSHTLKLPAANSLPVGWPLAIVNAASQYVTIKNGNGDTIASVPPATSAGATRIDIFLLYNASTPGIWDVGAVPAAVLGSQPLIEATALPTTATTAEIVEYLQNTGLALPE